MRVLTLLCVAAGAILTSGCFEKLSGPNCTPATWDVAGTTGDTITTTRGLRYIAGDTGKGNGTAWCKAVWVDYTGYLLDGTKFDSSIDIGAPCFSHPELAPSSTGSSRV